MKRRAKAIWLLAVVGCGTLFAVLHDASQEPDLLRRAQFVATGDQWQSTDSFTWMSDSRQFCERSYSYKPVVQAGLFWFDAKTKTAVYDSALQARVKLGYSNMRLSPDHKWILSGDATEYDVSNHPVRRVYYLASMHDNTTRRIEIGSHFIGAQWCSDSRHWIEFTGKGGIEGVAIGSVDDPQRTCTIRIAPKSLLRDPGLFWG